MTKAIQTPRPNQYLFSPLLAPTLACTEAQYGVYLFNYGCYVRTVNAIRSDAKDVRKEKIRAQPATDVRVVEVEKTETRNKEDRKARLKAKNQRRKERRKAETLTKTLLYTETIVKIAEGSKKIMSASKAVELSKTLANTYVVPQRRKKVTKGVPTPEENELVTKTELESETEEVASVAKVGKSWVFTSSSAVEVGAKSSKAEQPDDGSLLAGGSTTEIEVGRTICNHPDRTWGEDLCNGCKFPCVHGNPKTRCVVCASNLELGLDASGNRLDATDSEDDEGRDTHHFSDGECSSRDDTDDEEE